jgi:hypothetical protein
MTAPAGRRRGGPSHPTAGILRASAAALAAAVTAIAAAAEPPVPSFTRDVIPVLTKAGCNSGGCHAKANIGQNGFRLSLLGFEPAEDHEHIATEARGRRISPAAPDESLLLRKASAAVPHGGGLRLAGDSPGYAVLRRWIAAGGPPPAAGEAVIESISVSPARLTVGEGAATRLTTTARYSDGGSRDVTALALYEAVDRGRLEVDEEGIVRARDVPGAAAVMVRYQGKVAVASFTIPRAGAVAAAPADEEFPAEDFIDRFVFARLREVGIPASPECDDATFHRRVSLDITGAIPTVEAAAAFLESPAADRRARLVDSLLADPGYADFFANKWTALLKNRRDDASDTVSNFAFHSWIRDSLLANKPYDRLVRELLAATGTVVENPPVAWYKRVRDPRQQVEDVAQLFLGTRIQCAQCHHHPFERWSQADYHSLAAYFSQVGRTPTTTRGEDLIFHKRGVAGVTDPRTGATLRPAALGRTEPPIAPDDDPRLRLADWMAAPDNPFFARALVNRYWKHFFGRGLVEPEDDLRDTNPATHPELLDALAGHFRRSGFDLKALVRTIVSSKAYRLSAVPVPGNAADTQNFSHFQPRRLPAEVLLDAIDRATGTTTAFANLPAGTTAVALPDNSYTRSSAFLKVFGRPDGQSVCECERSQSSSLGQSLHLIAAGDVKAKLAAADGRAARLARSTAGEPAQVRELFLAAFAREPTPGEAVAARAWLSGELRGADGSPLPREKARQEQFEDLLWALVNSKEFLFNH